MSGFADSTGTGRGEFGPVVTPVASDQHPVGDALQRRLHLDVVGPPLEGGKLPDKWNRPGQPGFTGYPGQLRPRL